MSATTDPSLPTSIAEAGAWLRQGRTTSVVLTERLLGRAEATQGTLSAFITITRDAALEAARRADQELANGQDRGPLHGIPLGVKDILATKDAPSTANSRVLDPAWGTRGDATVVGKLRAAGAVILGKLALHEYAIGWPDPDTGFGVPRNPWNTAHSPGGSSSGTGIGVAAGLILGGLGTDTGGSIRIPAAYCGISGIKPTYGRVSKEGCVPLAYSLDHIGPMARTARDCALMLQVMAGYDPADPDSLDVPVPDIVGGLRGAVAGLRIGIPRAYFFETDALHAEVKAAVLAAIDQLAAAGATLVDVDLPHAAAARVAQRLIMFGEAYAYHERDLQTRPELYGKWTRMQILQGALFSSADYIQAQRVRSLVRSEVAQVLAGVDVLAMPTMAGLAQPFEGYGLDGSLAAPSFTGIWNLTGLPALSVPCGLSESGLPIGLQIVGKPFDEAMVLRVGDAYQQLTDWHTRAPEVALEAAAEVA